MTTLGQMTDYGINDCHFEISLLFDLFLMTGIARQFETGNPKYIAGMSGEELACTMFELAGIKRSFPRAAVMTSRTPEYWCGWIMAHCQWKTAFSFHTITTLIPPQEFLRLYPTLHEAPEQKTVDLLLERNREYQTHSQTRLARLRAYAKLTQAQLSNRSGVSLRSIQMYEQRNKDINKAQAITLQRLVRVLGCEMADIMEP